MAQPASKKRKTEAADAPDITDARFVNIQSDPRYRLPGKQQKVKLDKRFGRALKDEDYTRKAKVDRYGRSIESDAERKRLKRRYEFEEESEPESDDADDDEEVQQELTRVNQMRDVLREGRDVSSSEEDSSGDEDSVAEDDLVGQPEIDVQPGDDMVMGEVSSRLAVVNLDWDNIRAEDLMAVFTSFLPASGRLLKVSVYPSEFGRERMEREELEGPPKEIFASNNNGRSDGESSDEEEEEEDDEDDIKADIIKPDDGSEFDSTALRQYQLDRLRYFYAVLTFSSAATAKSIYDAVDGTEYLSTANFFDLRFVPDDTNFSDDKPREECDKLPAGYKPNDFVTDALQHSKVKLTWDAEDGSRKEAQARAFKGGRKEIDENDLKAYLASDDDSEDEREGDVAGIGGGSTDLSGKDARKEAERQKMRALLGLAPEPVKKSKKEKAGPTGNIQITFSSGLGGQENMSESDENDGSSKVKKRSVFENSPEPDETTMEKYVRKERERKQRRKDKMKANRTNDEEQEPDKAADPDLGFNDPFFAEPNHDKTAATRLRKEERIKRRQEREAEEAASAKQRAELELLMADDDQAANGTGPKGRAVRHFDMNEIEKAEKAMAKKGKKKHRSKSKTEAEQVLAADDFQINTADPRFASLYEDHEFGIDPTNSRLQSTKGTRALLDEGRRRKIKTTDSDVQAQSFDQKDKKVRTSKKPDPEGVLGLIEKIKRRHQ